MFGHVYFHQFPTSIADFDGLSDADYDEDVFSTGESSEFDNISSESDNISVNGSDVLPRSENNGYSDSDSDNEISKLLNKNLIFENQKLTQTMIPNGKFCNNESNIIRTIHSSRPLAIDYSNQGVTESRVGHDISRYSSMMTDNSVSQVQATNACHRTISPSRPPGPETVPDSSSVDSTAICTYSYNRYSGGRDRSVDERDNYCSMNFPWLEILFAISCFSFIALNTQMAPTLFVFSVLMGQLLYCVIRFLLKLTED